MVTVYESVDTFNSKFKETQNVKDGDMFTGKELEENFPGVIAEHDIKLIIDNNIPYGYYKWKELNEEGLNKY